MIIQADVPINYRVLVSTHSSYSFQQVKYTSDPGTKRTLTSPMCALSKKTDVGIRTRYP